MPVEIITKDDLNQFRAQLLQDLKILITPSQPKAVKEWLKGAEVRKLLGISQGTLQNLRITGKIRTSKIGGIHYYRYSDLEVLLNGKGK